jgi:phosphinothricin acetyltransferase
VIGWAALGRISTRAVYAGEAEVSIHVAEGSRGLGVGRTLLQKLIADSEADGRLKPSVRTWDLNARSG